MNKTILTVGFIARERFSAAEQSLASVLASNAPIQCIIVDCAIPEKYSAKLYEIIEEHDNCRVIKTEGYIGSNEARNIVFDASETEFICWIDNDVLVEPDSFSLLLNACIDKPSDVVVPMIFERFNGLEWFHMDDRQGFIKKVEGSIPPRLEIVNRDYSVMINDSNSYIDMEMFENHCVLLRRSVAEKIAPLNPALNTRQEVDLSLALYHIEAKVIMEPKCKVTFLSPPPIEDEERNFFNFKWDLETAENNHHEIVENWDLINLPSSIPFIKKRRQILEEPDCDQQKSAWEKMLGIDELLGIASQVKAITPPGTRLAFVDDQFFNFYHLMSIFTPELRLVPFLEKDGVYWGAPPDSATAIQALTSMRKVKMDFFILAAPAFWWIDYYPEFMSHLRESFPCIIENEDIIAFDLREALNN